MKHPAGQMGRSGGRGRVTGVVMVAALTTFAAVVLSTAAAGSTDGESTFVPMQPCRLTDTRPEFGIGPHGTIGPDDTVTIRATGTHGDCTISEQAVALSLNVTTVNTSLETFLTIWADGPRPNASSINPAPGIVAYNAVTTPLSESGTFRVYNRHGTTDVVIDVVGIYVESTVTDLLDRITQLEQTQPRAWSVRGDDLEPITSTARTMVQLGPIDLPPAHGNVTVDYALTVEQAEPGVRVECLISTYGDPFWIGEYVPVQVWESSAGSTIGQLAGTAVGSLWIDNPDLPKVVCRHDGSGAPTIASNIVMTVVYTPLIGE